MPTRSIAATLALAGALIAPGSAGAEDAPRILHPVFSDHAVLQRERPIRVWGRAAAGDDVAVDIAGSLATATADAAGRWSATLPALPAGGPHTLSARSRGGSQSVADLLVGDVWLCSGQSNMELPVSRSLGGDAELRAPARESLRLLTIEKASSPVPLAEPKPPLAWSVAGPDSIGDFSATCYYFARELQPHVDVPLGLIDASWGGSAIQAWIGEEGLRAVGGFEEPLDLLSLHGRDPAAANRRMGELWEEWWRSRVPDSEPWTDAADDADWREASESLGDWKQWSDPDLAAHHGMVWFRRRVELTPEQATQAATLSLGGIDEVDQTWVNGRPVGNTFGWGTERTYDLPMGALRAGENVVVVNVLNTWAAGGMLGPPDRLALRFADGGAVPLAGEWRYRVVPVEVGRAPRAPWETIAGLTGLHGGMIAPIAPYGLRGVAWYQGETNADVPEGYRELLAGLMADWRATFEAELPFLVVQLPGFGPAPTEPVASNWAEIREAQRRAVADDARAGLAVTIDVGDRDDLHPANKRDVARRLARSARHVVYGAAITPSGPVPLEASFEGERVAVTFGAIEGELVTYSASRAIGFELCGADQASCRFVPGVVDGERVLLDPEGMVGPRRVRFCWGDGPLCNLYDRSGLPAGPFELELRR